VPGKNSRGRRKASRCSSSAQLLGAVSRCGFSVRLLGAVSRWKLVVQGQGECTVHRMLRVGKEAEKVGIVRLANHSQSV
jgi:hypothetical protein